MIKQQDVCPVCDGTGWKYWEDENGHFCCSKCPQCRVFQNHIVDQRIRSLAIPEMFKHSRLDSFKLGVYKTGEGRNYASTACRAVKYWLDHLDEMQDRGRGLYLYSQTKGTGKPGMDQ